jgi:hypothetical protein
LGLWSSTKMIRETAEKVQRDLTMGRRDIR